MEDTHYHHCRRRQAKHAPSCPPSCFCRLKMKSSTQNIQPIDTPPTPTILQIYMHRYYVKKLRLYGHYYSLYLHPLRQWQLSPVIASCLWSILGEDSIGHLSDFPFRVSSQLKMGIFEIGISKIPILVYSRRRHKIRPSTEVKYFWGNRHLSSFQLSLSLSATVFIISQRGEVLRRADWGDRLLKKGRRIRIYYLRSLNITAVTKLYVQIIASQTILLQIYST